MHGRHDEAVQKWEEYQERNRPTKPANPKGGILIENGGRRWSLTDKTFLEELF